MEKRELSRKRKMVNSFLDSSEEAMTKWLNEFIDENLPKTMTWTTTKIKELVLSLSDKSNTNTRDRIRNIILFGIEIGENNKEEAMVLAMREVGISEEQIIQVLENTPKYMVTKKDVKLKDKK